MDTDQAIMNVAFNALQAELNRGETLYKKAERLIAAVAVISGFQVLDMKTVISSQAGFYLIIGVVFSFVLLAASLVHAFLSIRVMEQKGYPEGRELLKRLEKSMKSAEKLTFEISGLYLDITSANTIINNKRAGLLKIGGHLLLAALLAIVVTNVTKLVLNVKGGG
jgi:uncharacterized membrane protein